MYRLGLLNDGHLRTIGYYFDILSKANSTYPIEELFIKFNLIIECSRQRQQAIQKNNMLGQLIEYDDAAVKDLENSEVIPRTHPVVAERNMINGELVVFLHTSYVPTRTYLNKSPHAPIFNLTLHKALNPGVVCISNVDVKTYKPFGIRNFFANVCASLIQRRDIYLGKANTELINFSEE